MKVTGIHIEDFHQFKKLDIDLTYPKGHEKEGQPLEKVCIIGQSGTGKTKLLEIISWLTHFNVSFINKYGYSKNRFRIFLKDEGLTWEQTVSSDRALPEMFNERENGTLVNRHDFREKLLQGSLASKPNLIFFPADLKHDFSGEPINLDLTESPIIDFSITKVSSLWDIIFNQIRSYQENELVLRQEISRVAENLKNDNTAIEEAVSRLEEWKRTTVNPIVDLAEKCLDPILYKFWLRVKTTWDIFYHRNEIGSLKIEHFDGNEIPFDNLSTGTKQIVLSALPFYLLKPSNCIILYDEPERSLYPDMQKEIIDYYSTLANDCQFFFATHSPIIASSFEPWEIVELKFNNVGNIYQKLYYEQERHVDNYTVSPDHLTYDLILSKVFDWDDTNSIREAKITEVLMLRNQLEKLKKEGKLATPQGEQIYEEYIKLAKKLAWSFDLTGYEKA